MPWDRQQLGVWVKWWGRGIFINFYRKLCYVIVNRNRKYAAHNLRDERALNTV